MTAGIYDIRVEQGATFTRTFTLRDSANALLDLTGATARMQVRASTSSPAAIVTFTTENGRITVGTGTLTLTLPASYSSALPAGFFVYDLELVIGASVKRVLEGEFCVAAEVTR